MILYEKSATFRIMRQAVGEESVHGSDAQHAQLFRSRFPGFGFLLRRNTRRFGGRVFSALRLHSLLWPVRFYLYSAGPFRLPALQCAGELLAAACLLRDRLSPGADHGAISSSKSDTPAPVGLQPLPTCLRFRPLP